MQSDRSPFFYLKEIVTVGRMKIIYLPQEGQCRQWQDSFIEVFGDRHDWRIYG